MIKARVIFHWCKLQEQRRRICDEHKRAWKTESRRGVKHTEKQMKILELKIETEWQDRDRVIERGDDRQIKTDLCHKTLSWELSQEQPWEMRQVRMNSPPPSVFYRNALEQPMSRFTPEARKFFHNKEPRGHSARKFHLRKYWQDQPPTPPVHSHSHSVNWELKIIQELTLSLYSDSK